MKSYNLITKNQKIKLKANRKKWQLLVENKYNTKN